MFDTIELEELHRKAAGDDLALASDDELLAAATSMARARAAFDAAELHLLGELDARGVTDRDFGLKTASWVAHVTHGDRRVVACRLGVARKLRHCLGQVDHALSRGELSFEHVRAMSYAANPRIETEIVAEQADWIARGAEAPFKVWDHDLRYRSVMLDQDGAFDPARERARNRLKLTPFGPEDFGISGELVGDEAVATAQALEHEADRLFHQFTREHNECPDLEVPSRSTLMALAFMNLVRRGAGTDVESTRGPGTDLAIILHPDGEVTTPDGTVVRAERYPHLFCDPCIHPATFDADGLPLHLGRAQRLASAGQRRMIAIRDGGCTFAGCDVPFNWCDIHHVDHWDDGGLTDIDTLTPQCRYHHMVTHRPGWTMTATDDQRFVWTTPTGRVIHSQRHNGRPPPDG